MSDAWDKRASAGGPRSKAGGTLGLEGSARTSPAATAVPVWGTASSNRTSRIAQTAAAQGAPAAMSNTRAIRAKERILFMGGALDYTSGA